LERGKVKAVVRNILNGIAAYESQQREILDAIRRHGGVLHQNDFDKEFNDFTDVQQPDGTMIRRMKVPRVGIWPITKQSFILGAMHQLCDWSKYLHLAQLMAQAGLLRIEGKPPNITYRAVGG
jgi:hypothetical protein